MREVCAAVLDGELERNAEVTLSLSPLTATGMMSQLAITISDT